MKKWFAFLIVVSFLFAGSAVSFASEPVPFDRHAVWSNWDYEKGKRVTGERNTEGSESRTPEPAQTRMIDKKGMDSKTTPFDFIKETKVYDYSKEHGSSKS